MADQRFSGQVAVVTGGAGGLGKAAAARLVADGARVVLVDVDGDALSRAATEVEAATSIVCDVTDEAAVAGYVRQAVAEHGKIDLFFNNAGIEGKLAPITEQEMSNFDRVIAVNLRGVFLGLREVMRQMKQQASGGAIVNTASMAGIRGGPNFSPYIASKHAVVGLTKTAALEGAPYRIRVNAVAPGHIDTRMAWSLVEQRAPDDPRAAMAAVAERIPFKRYGTPDEVANLVTWLLSDEADYVSGSINLIDAALNA